MPDDDTEIGRLRQLNTMLLAAAQATVNFAKVAESGDRPALECLQSAAKMAKSAAAAAEASVGKPAKPH